MTNMTKNGIHGGVAYLKLQEGIRTHATKTAGRVLLGKRKRATVVHAKSKSGRARDCAAGREGYTRHEDYQ